MNVVYLSPDIVMKVTREPVLYTKFPFLTPMQSSTLRVHAQMEKLGCNGCAKGARDRAATFIAGAFMNLVQQEAARQPNKLAELKAYMSTALNAKVDEVRMIWHKGGQKGEIVF